MFTRIKSLFVSKSTHAQLSRYDLNGIATCAWQRVQSRTLAKQALENQFPNFLVDTGEETERLQEARATENMVSHAINSTPELMVGPGSYQAEAPILDIAAARESTVDKMESVALEGLVNDEAEIDDEAERYQAVRAEALQRRIRELQAERPADVTARMLQGVWQ